MRHIGIAGAGIGGLAAAIALARAGTKVTLFDRAPVLGEAGAGLQLSPNACAALRRLGLLADVGADAVALSALRIGRGHDGAILAETRLGDVSTRRFGAPFLVTRRADLHRALRQRAESLPNVTLLLGAGLAHWTDTGGRLGLHFEEPERPPLIVDALVGADGLHSVVRARSRPPEPAPRRRGTAWRATIDAERLPAALAEPCSNLWLGPGAHVVHYPVSRGRLVNVVAALDDRDAPDRPSVGPVDAAIIAARFRDWSDPIRCLVAAAGRWGTWPLVDRPPLPRWTAGSITLLGDAAHPMLPFLAQGAAQALEDAVALGEALGASGDIASAFRLYESRRRPRTARVQRESRRQARIYHLPSPASMLRDAVLRARPPHRLLMRYDWLYGGPQGAGAAP